MTKSTRRALLSSVVALVLCLTMLIGTTFAWFTDTASTAVNTIQSGTLDVGIVDINGDSLEGKTLSFVSFEDLYLADDFTLGANGTAIEDGILWEPGCTYVTEPFTIENKGNLALKYQLIVNGYETEDTSDLMSAIDWYIGECYKTEEGQVTVFAIDEELSISNALTELGENNILPGEYAYGESRYLVLVGHMREDAGNEYQGLTAANNISITVVATQYTDEWDSTTNEYDKDAEYPEVTIVATSDADELVAALTSNSEIINVTLTDDVAIDIANLGQITDGSGQYKLGGADTTAINIDLAGHKLTLNTTYWSALGAKNNDCVITVKNGSMNSVGNNADTWNAYDLTFYDCQWNFEDVTFDKAVAIATGTDTTMTNVTINESNSNSAAYALWITAEGQTVTLDNVTIKSNGGKDTRAIAIKDQYVANPAKVTLIVKNSTFASASKAAVLVTSKAGATITASNVDISGVATDSTNLVWIDNGAGYRNISDTTVTGCTAIVEP